MVLKVEGHPPMKISVLCCFQHTLDSPLARTLATSGYANGGVLDSDRICPSQTGKPSVANRDTWYVTKVDTKVKTAVVDLCAYLKDFNFGRP